MNNELSSALSKGNLDQLPLKEILTIIGLIVSILGAIFGGGGLGDVAKAVSQAPGLTGARYTITFDGINDNRLGETTAGWGELDYGAEGVGGPCQYGTKDNVTSAFVNGRSIGQAYFQAFDTRYSVSIVGGLDRNSTPDDVRRAYPNAVETHHYGWLQLQFPDPHNPARWISIGYTGGRDGLPYGMNAVRVGNRNYAFAPEGCGQR